MPTMEQIIRPFQGEDVSGIAYVPPGGNSQPPVNVHAGLVGGTQTFTGDISYTRTTKVGAVHKEKPSNSQVIKDVIASPSSYDYSGGMGGN